MIVSGIPNIYTVKTIYEIFHCLQEKIVLGGEGLGK